MAPRAPRGTPSETAELTARQEGKHVRVLVNGGRSGNYLFADSRCAAVVRTYLAYVERARRFFARRWHGPICARLGNEAFRKLTRDVTLDWMYFYIVNHRPVRFLVADLDHPSAWRTIQRVVFAAPRLGQAKRAEACAQLMGISAAEYQDWLVGEERYLNK